MPDIPKVVSYCFLLCLLLGFSMAKASENDWLNYMDSLRVQGKEALVKTRVQLFKDQTLQQEKDYDVYVGEGQKSVAVFRSKREKGQKVLMLGDDYWLLLPGSRRQIRISPTQKLLGEASTGDISQLRWSQDYQPEDLGLEQPAWSDVRVQHLELSGNRAGLSYQKIQLWLNPETRHPVRADLYLTSGKLAKTALFKVGLHEGREQMEQMTLLDRIKTSERTEVHYLSVESVTLPPPFFNPAYLRRIN